MFSPVEGEQKALQALSPTKLGQWVLNPTEGEQRFYRCSVLQNENASQVLNPVKEVP